ncbi:MAG: transglutaminase domain-containing protein [Bacteroidales bacterium]|nr:transglutaminase domain-containing protein [Bacteroidales bacterium]
MRIGLFPGILILLFFTGCNDDHFITNQAYRNRVETQFKKQKELSKGRSQQLFSVFNQDLTTPETEALKFLFAYSSLSDLADYTGEFYLRNIRSSFAARDTFAWGKTIPENLFRHFVLPIRVNNENLDSSRWVFFTELKDRIKGLSMKDAVLEINHWCHEKVSYRASDSRTSSPLASVKTAFGRCGEESTFTVAALRSVGIPARQCYTPRWAHSDDNHAWVEVWVDGKWHFIGACEPDVDLDMGWFAGPVKRAMLVNTTVFGDYDGPEDVLQKDPLFTKINILKNYAPVKKVVTRVTDTLSRTADSAVVEFQLYNYAEFYPLFRTVTGKDGFCSFKTGYGDLLVWAAKDGRYGFQKFDGRTADTVIIKLDREPGQTYDIDFDMVPPAEPEATTILEAKANKEHSERLSFEDGLRMSYEATFIDSLKSRRFARLVKLDPDTLWRFFRQSRGNWRFLTSFITQCPPDKKQLIFPLFENISEKDLRDIDTAVLIDNVNNSSNYDSRISSIANYYRYILSPRIDLEFLKPYRKKFQEAFDSDFINKSRQDPMQIAEWIRNNIVLNKTGNYSRAPLTPVGAFELKVADGHSANICFVAICRSFGIPARLDPATKVPQYLVQELWHDVYLYEKKQNSGNKVMLVLLNPVSNEKKPEYSIHYTLEEYSEGFFRTLDYENSPLVREYPCSLDIPAGPCMMVTGNRLTNGTVQSKLKVFEVNSATASTQSIELRKHQLSMPEYGTLDPALFNRKIPDGMIIAWVDPDREPTRHFVADLRKKKSEFGRWKGSFIMIFSSEDQMNSFVKKEAAGLPGNISHAVQSNFPVKPGDITMNTGILRNLPIILFINKDWVINYRSEGYRIGIGDELLTIIK